MKKYTYSLRQRLTACLCAAFFLFFLSAPICSAASMAADSGPIGGKDSGLVNLLLIGQDRREESGGRSDCVILCSFHPETRQITITSFLRDLYVEIPGYESNRLNAAYAHGGMELLQQTMEQNFDLSIDACIEADFSHFSQIIDILGGVTIDLRQDEADLINKTVPGTLTEGTQLLSGDQALAYSRIRNLDRDGDFSRTLRQRRLLSSLLDSYRSASLLTVLSVVVDVLPMISTNLTRKQVLVLAATLFPMLDSPAIKSQRVPQDGTYAYSTIRNMEVLTADMDQVRSFLRESLLSSPEQNS